MQVQLYQVGHVPLHFHQTRSAYRNEAGGESEPLSLSHKTVFGYSQYRLDLRTVDIEGTLVPYGEMTPPAVYSALQQIIGLPTDIIGYALMGRCEACDCACLCKGACRVLWFHTRGRLIDLRPRYGSYHDGLEMTIEIDTFWKALNRGIWTFNKRTPPTRLVERPAPVTDEETNEMPGIIEPYPVCDELFNAECYGWQKRVYDSHIFKYESDYWQALTYQKIPPDMPAIGTAYEAYEPDGVTAKWVFQSPQYFNAPPLNIYKFSQAQNADTITISVTRESDIWEIRTDNTVLDMATLKTRVTAAGYPALASDDFVIIGEVGNMPGFVLLGDGTILNNVVVPVTYTGNAPGWLSPGMNKITIDADGSIFASHVHMYRRL